ncbi:MAG: DNA polymerase/3'-5' exonuclease PolX [Gemmatimonadales bacterium]|nr:MAG: DNA polymerase/3'-5' exonuclease PolX [Gemmatimonadales bacterium]
MDNTEISDRLSELADLLEIRGANPFRIRAYRNAVRTLRGLTRPLSAMVEDGEDLTELQGVGKDMASHIRELLDTGELELLEEVTAEVPRSLAQLVRLDGVGPKKARKLWKELEVTTVDELEVAIEDDRVTALEGFGPKSVEKMARAIRDHRKHQGRFLRTRAAELLAPLLEHMEGVEGIERLEVAGSFRRRAETVGDIDLLALAPPDRAPTIMEHFVSFPDVDRVEMSGETRGTVRLRAGLQVDLRILPESSYGAALHYFTGSKEHNVEIRKRARQQGLKVSEYGVFREEEDGDPVAGATEEEVFQAVGLPWIEPVLREDRGEIRAADEGTLPSLVTLEDIRGDLHMHTTWSDGKDSIADMARACRDRGYAYMSISDHSRAVTVARGLTPERLQEQWEAIEEARSEVEEIRILRSSEVDILGDGTLDFPDEVLAELDLVLVAVHSHFGLDQATQTKRILRALEHPMVDILVHPTGRLLNRREPYPVDVEALLEAALEHDVAVELNANPRRLDLHDRHLFRARELGLRVSVATDAHRTSQLDYMGSGLEQARRGWLEAGHVVNAMTPDAFETWRTRRDHRS